MVQTCCPASCCSFFTDYLHTKTRPILGDKLLYLAVLASRVAVPVKQLDVCVCVCVWVHASGWMDGWIHGWMDGWMDGTSHEVLEGQQTASGMYLSGKRPDTGGLCC